MIVGFTGSREGMTVFQEATFRNVLTMIMAKSGITDKEYIFIHGDCIGSDEEAAQIARDLGFEIIGYPANIPKYRAYFSSDVEKEPEQPLVRNRNIVKDCNLLIAMPKETFEPKPMQGQGTWSTIRYARKQQRLDRPCYIIWPNGVREVDKK